MKKAEKDPSIVTRTRRGVVWTYDYCTSLASMCCKQCDEEWFVRSGGRRMAYGSWTCPNGCNKRNG